MKHSSRFLLVACLLSSGLLGPPASAARELAVVVHTSCPMTTLTADSVKEYYLRRHKEWSDGAKVRPIQQEGDVRTGFLAKVLKMPIVEYERYWLERKYAAAESPPKSADDDGDVIKFVGAMKGAIGFVDVSSLDDAAKSKVKSVLTIAY
jgi:ABC-type phosphate transport system substrate-binding protein